MLNKGADGSELWHFMLTHSVSINDWFHKCTIHTCNRWFYVYTIAIPWYIHVILLYHLYICYAKLFENIERTTIEFYDFILDLEQMCNCTRVCMRVDLTTSEHIIEYIANSNIIVLQLKVPCHVNLLCAGCARSICFLFFFYFIRISSVFQLQIA